jgi:hypothetical protein
VGIDPVNSHRDEKDESKEDGKKAYGPDAHIFCAPEDREPEDKTECVGVKIDMAKS